MQCLPGGYRGADEQATCREFYLNVCWSMLPYIQCNALPCAR
jgi:hypothetical protein